MNHLFNKTRVFITVLLSLFLLSAASTDGQCNGDLDRQYRLETVGTLRAIDNVDGFFTEYVASAFERYFSQQSRLISIDLRLVDLAVSRSKLPYEKVIFDLDLLKRASQSARAESLIRTQVQKAGGIYSFTLEWLHAPKMEVIADLHFEMNEPKGEHGFIGGSLDQDLLSEGLKLQLSKLLHALPFFGQVSGRDREKVTLNIGEDEGLKVGDQVDLATIEEVKRHPLMNRIVDWKLRPTGQIVVEKVEGGMAFCRIVSEEPGVQVSRFQKVVRVNHLSGARSGPAVQEVDTKAEPSHTSEASFKKPQLGWIALSAPLGSYSRFFTSTAGSVSNRGGGFALGGRMEGEILLMRNWFLSARMGYEAWTFSQKDRSGVLTSASRMDGVPGSDLSYLLSLGYLVNFSEMSDGPRGWAKLGYKYTRTQLPTSTLENTGVMGLNSIFLGAGGSYPLPQKWSAFADLKFRLFSFAILNQIGASSSSDFEFILGGGYQFNNSMSFQVALENQLRVVSLSNGTSANQNLMTIAPSLLYHF